MYRYVGTHKDTAEISKSIFITKEAAEAYGRSMEYMFTVWHVESITRDTLLSEDKENNDEDNI